MSEPRFPLSSSVSSASGAPGVLTPPERRRVRRWRIVAPLVAVVALALAAAACAPPGGSGGGGYAGDVVNAMNQDRAAAGMGPLAWDSQLAGYAQNHAGEIASSGSLWHSNLSAWMSGWRSLGENLLVVSVGTSSSAAEDTWMASGPHRANILGGFNRVGVGLVTDGAGREWLVAVFGAR
jgi:uncharacterized protein YkwD